MAERNHETPSGYGPAHQPELIANRWVDAWNDRDADRLAALFAEDAEFVNVTGIWWHDREAIRRAHAYGFEAIFGASTISLVEKKVKWIVGTPDGDETAAVVVHAKMRLEGQSPVDEVERPGIRRTVFSFVVRRTGSRWICVSAQNTDVVPGSETNVVAPDGQLQSVSYRSASDSSSLHAR